MKSQQEIIEEKRVLPRKVLNVPSVLKINETFYYTKTEKKVIVREINKEKNNIKLSTLVNKRVVHFDYNLDKFIAEILFNDVVLKLNPNKIYE